MATLPASALPGAGAQPTGTDAQGGGLQPQAADDHRGTAKHLERFTENPMKQRKQNQKHHEFDGLKSSCAALHNRAISKTPLLQTSLEVLQPGVDALKRLQAETAAELDALLPALLD